LGAIVVYVILGFTIMARKALRRGVQKTLVGVKQGAMAGQRKKLPAGAQKRSNVLAFSLPMAVASVLLIPLLINHDCPLWQQQAPPSGQTSDQP